MLYDLCFAVLFKKGWLAKRNNVIHHDREGSYVQRKTFETHIVTKDSF